MLRVPLSTMTNPPKSWDLCAVDDFIPIAQAESRESLSSIFVPMDLRNATSVGTVFLSGIPQLTLSQWNVSRVPFQVP